MHLATILILSHLCHICIPCFAHICFSLLVPIEFNITHTCVSLQGYPGELVQSSGTDKTMDDVLTIMDEHYSNVNMFDVLNQELFQLWMADNETVSDWVIHISRHLQILAASFPDCFPPRESSRTEEGLLLWQTSQVIESNGSLPEGRTTGENVFRLP